MRHSKLEQAARQALEALEVSTDWDICAKGKQLQSMKAITALREALSEQADIPEWVDVDDYEEQAEQSQLADAILEPVAHREGFWCKDLICAKCYSADFRFKYAAPVRTKDLTDDEIEALIDKSWIELMTIKEFAHAVIAADREKNK